MKKSYLPLLLSLFLCGAATAQNISSNPLPQLSPATRLYLRDLEKSGLKGAPPQGYLYRRLADGQIYVPGIIKVSNAASVAEKLGKMGAVVGTKAGDIWTVQVPYQSMPAFAQTTGIHYIQIDEPVQPQLNVARMTTRVDSVHAGYGLPMRFTGQGVVTGIIDFGFDYNHPTLWDSAGANYRVKKVWQLDGTANPPAGYSYGNELTGSAAILAQGTDNPHQTHGTAVAGMAAGSGRGSAGNGTRLRGMAHESDMVFVGVRRDSMAGQWMSSGFSDFVDGINYIFQYAASAGKPAVVNISWGSQSGPHDGTTLMNQACNNLSGAGKLIVMSAGNEGEEKIHIAKTFSATDTVVNTFATFSKDSYKRTWIDIWGDTGKTFCGKITLYKNGVAGNTSGFVCLDNQLHSYALIGANGQDTCFADFITSTSEFNGKPRLTISLFNKAADSIGISVSGTSGNIHMWDEYYYYGYTYGYTSAFDSLGVPGAVGGNSVSTVSDMGAASSVLLVGAYASKVNFTDINNNSWTYNGYVGANQIVPFSSRGPMANNVVRPDITAPGLTIATAISSYDTSYTPTGSNSTQTVSSYLDPASGKQYYFAEFSGTSASAPAASGIVALMLQANPGLTPQAAKSIIAETAIKDVYTGTIPAGGSNTWGYGKINAYAAVKKALQTNGVYSFSGTRLDCALFPNPNHGSFTLDYTGSRAEVLQVDVVNITGAVVATQSWKVSAGNNSRQLDLQYLPKGTYIVKVMSRSGMAAIKTAIN